MDSTSPFMKASSAWSWRLQIAAQLRRFARQAFLQVLEAAVVIAHLRAEKNVANAIDIAALVDGRRRWSARSFGFVDPWVPPW